MRLLCWNVNSIGVRLPRLLAVLQRHQPDVVCLQETKVTGGRFPRQPLEALGYQIACLGQKSYNGVAILAKQPIEAVQEGFADARLDAQARLLAARIGGIWVLCVYVPNGGHKDSPKYAYKLRFLARLRQLLEQQHRPDARLILCGDLNVAPRDCDVAQPEVWANTVLCDAAARAGMQALLQWGLVDTGAQIFAAGGVYSWWDYRAGGFARNNGLRIDHVLCTLPLQQRLRQLQIDRDERRGPQPSDHAPVLADFDP